MSIQNTIKFRRSVYPVDYNNKPISKDVLVELLDCANAAPTHKLTQPWRYIVFHQQGLSRLVRILQEAYRVSTPVNQHNQKKIDSIAEKVLKSGAVMAICLHLSGRVPEEEEFAAVACSVQNIWLAAYEQGIGAYWSTPAFLKQLNKELDLQDNERCVGLFYMGYHDEMPRSGKRSPMEEKTTWVIS